MDRARRIREMREGSRPDEQADDSPDDDNDAEDSPHANARADANGDASTTGDGAAADPAAEDDGAVEEGTAMAPAAAPDTVDGSDATEADGDDADDETSVAGLAVEADDGGTVQIPAAEMEDVAVDVEQLAEQAGLDITGDDGERAADPGEEVAGVGMASARAREGTVETTAETRVLEFNLGPDRYCLDIEHVEEIVKRDTVTRVPNTPDYVEGVVDLRGQITTILDPTVLLDIDAEGSKELIVVYDPEGFEDQGALGWIVDDVNQVTPIVDEEVNDSPVDVDRVHGVVERDDEFVIWTDPGAAIEDAAG
jgi:purine-binding chemotaxis protein CheW